jgi:hypothetical protein
VNNKLGTGTISSNGLQELIMSLLMLLTKFKCGMLLISMPLIKKSLGPTKSASPNSEHSFTSNPFSTTKLNLSKTCGNTSPFLKATTLKQFWYFLMIVGNQLTNQENNQIRFQEFIILNGSNAQET